MGFDRLQDLESAFNRRIEEFAEVGDYFVCESVSSAISGRYLEKFTQEWRSSMNHGIEWWVGFYNFIESPRCCDIGDDSKVKPGTEVWEVGKNLLRFGLTSNNTSD